MTFTQPRRPERLSPAPSAAAHTNSLAVVSCNHCGGALEVNERTHYTTCGYCGTRLRVERSASSLATIELDDLRERTDDIERSVSALRDDKAVEQLDRAWGLRRDEFRISNGDGDPRLPTLHGALMRLVSVIIPLALLVAGPFNDVGGYVPVILLGAAALAAVQAGIEGYKFLRYRSARQAYEAERSALLRRGH